MSHGQCGSFGCVRASLCWGHSARTAEPALRSVDLSLMVSVCHLVSVCLTWPVCVSHGQCVSWVVCLTWSVGLCVSWAVSWGVYHTWSVCHTWSLCLTWACVSHIGSRLRVRDQGDTGEHAVNSDQSVVGRR